MKMCSLKLVGELISAEQISKYLVFFFLLSVTELGLILSRLLGFYNHKAISL